MSYTITSSRYSLRVDVKIELPDTFSQLGDDEIDRRFRDEITKVPIPEGVRSDVNVRIYSDSTGYLISDGMISTTYRVVFSW